MIQIIYFYFNLIKSSLMINTISPFCGIHNWFLIACYARISLNRRLYFIAKFKLARKQCRSSTPTYQHALEFQCSHKIFNTIRAINGRRETAHWSCKKFDTSAANGNKSHFDLIKKSSEADMSWKRKAIKI